MVEPEAAPAYYVDPDCPHCEYVPKEAEAVWCRECTRPHHLGCFLTGKGCGEPGCQGRVAEARKVGAADPPAVLLQRRAEPRMWFFVFLTTYVVAMYATLLLAPAYLQGHLSRTLGVGFLFGCGALGLAQGLVTRGYRFDPHASFVAKQTMLGPFVLQRDKYWRRFEDVESLDVQLVRRSLSPDDSPSYVVQVWLRYPGGADLALREEELDHRSPGLARTLDAARASGTTITITVLGEELAGDLRVSRITGMPVQAPR